MSDVAETLDPLRLPLQGERLIEASAGTGKTFTIAALYLRLLLGLGGSAAFPRPLTVEELLVVTFTEAATAELRGRIRSNKWFVVKTHGPRAVFQLFTERGVQVTRDAAVNCRFGHHRPGSVVIVSSEEW